MIYLELAKRFWPFILAAVLFSTGYGYGHHNDHVVMQKKLTDLQVNYDTFVQLTEAAGRQATKTAESQTAIYKQEKERADANYETAVAGLNTELARLRNKERTRGNILPAAPAGSSDPAAAKVDRAEFESAYRQLVAGLQDVGAEGDTGIEGLNNAKDWAQK